jgi:V/A-type H+-transporting ATPase subunit I
MMFFGLCLGDAGYGLLILIGATLYKRKASRALHSLLSLGQWLGLATVIFGIVTGTFFGLNLLGDKFAFLGSLRNIMLDSNQIFNFALVLGFIQIIFGLGIQIANKVKQYGWKYAVTPLAWIFMLFAIADMSILKLTGPASMYVIYGAIGSILLFNDPDSGILPNIGKGIWELYGITGFVGDLLSYIRLFALGISGAILGLVVNDIALRMLSIDWIGPVLFIVFLIFGHGLNLMISTLGAFVHPLRLTFVEFYKNAGFTGGGKEYKPFGGKV